MDELIQMELDNLVDLDTCITALWWVVLEDHEIYDIQANLLNSISDCIDLDRCFKNMDLSRWA